MSVLIDSDILIEVLRGHNAVVLSQWSELALSGESIMYSAASVAELWAGARPREYAALTELFDSLHCVPVDVEVARRAGEYLSSFRKSHSTELADAVVAASAVLLGATLWTRNRKHYPMKDIVFYGQPA